MRTVVLDNEAVQALLDAGHPKHRTVIAHVAGVVTRRQRGPSVEIVVPTAVRVEAGWDRSDPSAATANRLRVRDEHLDTPSANLAARIRIARDVSVADAHAGAVMRTLTTDDVVVLTSDVGDMERVAAPRRITAVRI
ncbi:MAG TPA: hypothetical protein VM143_01155 [Acidimicrobiales bacterium]|nr:hypothetical protein [Acidimicrobiales bacterium]